MAGETETRRNSQVEEPLQALILGCVQRHGHGEEMQRSTVIVTIRAYSSTAGNKASGRQLDDARSRHGTPVWQVELLRTAHCELRTATRPFLADVTDLPVLTGVNLAGFDGRKST